MRRFNFLPTVRPYEFDFVGNWTLIAAAGFEDRALHVASELKARSCFAHQSVLIKYLPFDRRNRLSHLSQLLRLLLPSNQADNFHNLTYDRRHPEVFADNFRKQANVLCNTENIIVDISGMSKFLVVVLLNELMGLQKRVLLLYSEAKIYHPAENVYIRNLSKTDVSGASAFLTTEIANVVTTQELTGGAMQGYPVLMIAFATFNSLELLSLVSEITPEKLILIYGIPPDMHNRWRLDAVKHLNRHLAEFQSNIETKDLSTLEYQDTMEFLEDVYEKYGSTHRIVLAPTGSKLQSVATLLFKVLRPDIHIVYPVTKSFDDEYSEGESQIWSLDLGIPSKLTTDLASYRRRDLSNLKRLIDSLLITAQP